MALNNLSHTYMRLTDYVSAQEYGRQSLALKRQIGDLAGEGKAINNLALVSYYQGDFVQALEYFIERGAINNKLGDPAEEGQNLQNIGVLQMTLGDYTGAKQLLEQTVEIYEQLASTQRVTGALNNLGLANYYLGNLSEALTSCERALSLSRQYSGRNDESNVLTNLGHIFLRLQRYQDAINSYRLAGEIRAELGLYTLRIESIAGLLDVWIEQKVHGDIFVVLKDVYEFLMSSSTNGMLEPFRVYLSTYRVLIELDDQRAELILERAYHELQATAHKITDARWKDSYLESVPAHHEIIYTYNRRR